MLLSKKFLSIYFFITLLSCVNGQELTISQWKEDLNYIEHQLKENHPNLYYKYSEDEFLAFKSKAIVEIENSKNNLKAYLILKKYLANVYDGHTQLIDNGLFQTEDIRFPFRIGKFSDGYFFTVVSIDKKELFGKQIVSIEGKKIDDVVKSIMATINMDNNFGKTPLAVTNLSYAKVLFGLGIIKNTSSVSIEVLNDQGKLEIVKFNSIPNNTNTLRYARMNMKPTKGKFINIETELSMKTPLHLRYQDVNYKFHWFEHLEDKRTLYFQYNQVANQPNHDETWNEFNDRLWNYIDNNESTIDKLVIDLRYNDGGNGLMMYSFINEIIRRPKFSDGNNLLVLIGDITYSAPVILISELSLHTNARFIGFPIASSLTFFSNRRTVGQLPNSKASLGIASITISNEWYRNREVFLPDIEVELSSKDYFSGKDVALKKAVEINN